MKYAVGYTFQFDDGSGGLAYFEHGSLLEDGPVMLFDSREEAEAAIAKAYGMRRSSSSPMPTSEYQIIECPNGLASVIRMPEEYPDDEEGD